MPRPESPSARLVWTLYGEVRFDPVPGPNRLAADALVAHMRGRESVSPADEAHLVAASMLGEAVDADPTNAALWGQYRAALDVVRGVGDGDDDAFTRLLAELGASPVRDSSVAESADPGSADSASGRRSRPPADASSAADSGRRRRGST